MDDIQLPHPELPPRPPRDAEYGPEVRSLRLFVLGITAIILLLGAMVWLYPHLKMVELHDKGVLIAGTVTFKYQGIPSGKGDYFGGTGYFLDYKYTDSGRTIDGVEGISYHYYNSARIGDPITIYALPDNPAYHSVGPTTKEMVQTDVVMPAAICIAILMAAAILILASELSARKNLKRLRTWEAAVGTVVRSPGPGMIVLKYICSDGQERTAIQWPRKRDISVDSEVILLYNPKNRNQVMLFEELKHVRLVGDTLFCTAF